VPEITRELTEALLAVVTTRMAEQGLSGRGLAESTGIQQATLSRKLRGTGDFTVDELDAVALALGARDVEELLIEARHRL